MATESESKPPFSGQVSKGRRVRLHAGMTRHQALRAIIGVTERQLQSNVPGIVLDPSNPEFIHQARVALRRLRSAQTSFEGIEPDELRQTITTEIKWLGTLLGNARDLDVLLTETLPTIASACADSSDLTPLKKAAHEYRSKIQRQLRSALQSKRYAALLLRLDELQKETNGASVLDQKKLLDLASASLHKNQRRVNRLARKWKKLNQEQRHDLRKRIKKLRYSAAFFSSLYKRKAVNRYLDKLARLQRSLGTLNDAVATQKIIASLSESDASLQHSAGLVIGWQLRAAKYAESEMEQGLKRLKTAKPFW